MVEAAHPGEGERLCAPRRPFLSGAPSGRVSQARVHPLGVVVRDVFGEEPPEVTLAEHDHVIQELAQQVPIHLSATGFCQGLW